MVCDCDLYYVNSERGFRDDLIQLFKNLTYELLKVRKMSPLLRIMSRIQTRTHLSVPLRIITGCLIYSPEVSYCWCDISLLTTKQQSDPLIPLFFLHRYYHFNVWLLILLRGFSSPPTPSLNQAKRQVTDFISQKCNPQVHNSSCQISFSVSWWVYCGSTQKAEPEKFYNIWHTFNMACELKITACHLPLQVDFIKV